MGSLSKQDVTSNQVASIIPFRELEPSWHVPGAKQGGCMRWLISWVGGPKGFVNPSQGRAVVGENIGVGYMYLPVGQRQEDLHYHTITEIYIIIKGQVQSYGPNGAPHIAGPMDCIYIPPGVPHGVRNCGFEDVELIWLHDGVEEKGLTVYCHTEEDIQNAPSHAPIMNIKFQDLEPFWDAYRAKEPEYMRWGVNWVGGKQGFQNLNPNHAAESDQLALGMTVLMPGNKLVPHSHGAAEVYVVVKGTVLLNLGEGTQQLTYLDGAYFPPHIVHSVRNGGTEPAYIVWVHEKPQPKGKVVYQDPNAPSVVNGNGTV